MEIWTSITSYLPAIGIAGGSVLFFGLIGFNIAARRKRHIMADYDRFVHEEYTGRGKPTPILILRIQNGYISDYNDLCTRWPVRLLRFRQQPLKDGMVKKSSYSNPVKKVQNERHIPRI